MNVLISWPLSVRLLSNLESTCNEAPSLWPCLTCQRESLQDTQDLSSSWRAVGSAHGVLVSLFFLRSRTESGCSAHPGSGPQRCYLHRRCCCCCCFCAVFVSEAIWPGCRSNLKRNQGKTTTYKYKVRHLIYSGNAWLQVGVWAWLLKMCFVAFLWCSDEFTVTLKRFMGILFSVQLILYCCVAVVDRNS